MGLFETLERTGPRDGAHLLITAAVHGDEHEGVQAVRRLNALLDDRDLSGRLTLIPTVNLSAYSVGRRTGGDGLDLARTFPGRPDGSITERVAHELTVLIRSSDFFIDLHSGGAALTIEPLVGYMLVSDAAVLEKQRQMARAFGLPIIWGTSSRLDGRSLSVARDAGVPAIYAEYLGGGECSSEGVEAYADGCLNVMRWCGLLPGAVESEPQQKLVIEDARPTSGHLQIQHPSPVDGTFVPLFQLGDSLPQGTTLGHVIDSSDQANHPVAAECTGRLICIRVQQQVEKGDSLAVILESFPEDLIA